MSQPVQPFRVPHWMLPPQHLCSQYVDEFCDCGHSVHDHEDRGPAYGHGECGWRNAGCECRHFFWARIDGPVQYPEEATP